jgi:hypothetical protein
MKGLMELWIFRSMTEAKRQHQPLIFREFPFGTEVVFREVSILPSGHFREKCPMKLLRMLLLLGFVTAVLLVATGGQFHTGIVLAIALTTLICLLEPSIAK